MVWFFFIIKFLLFQRKQTPRLCRKSAIPNSGYGLGFDRLIILITLITNISNIRDVILFSHTPDNIDF